MKFDFEITDNFKIILNNFRDFDHEVGGIIFGLNDSNISILITASIKHGSSYSIDFTIEDKQLFYPPEKLVIIGTWHLHPDSFTEIPSHTDVRQWLKWGPSFIHLIMSKSGCALFSFDAKLIDRFF